MQINVLEYFENGGASHWGRKVAVIDGEQNHTFGDLERYAKRAATLLIRRIDAVRQPVAVFLPKSADTIFADLGIAYSGNIYTNLDVKSPPQRIRNILDNIKPALVITSRALAGVLAGLDIGQDSLFFIEDIYDEAVGYDNASLWRRLEQVIDTDPLCIINTSGSTGIPKGVVLNHRSTIDFMDWAFDRLELDGTARIGSLSPFHFDIYSLELFLCLAKGATIIVIPEQFAAFPAKLMKFLADNAVSFIFWVPSLMVNISNQNLLDKFNLGALKQVLFAGEVFPTKHLNRWRRAVPGARFVNLYGPIEITVDCTYFIVDRELADDEPLPIGIPCRNSDVLILNEAGQPCRAGEIGELCVRGSSLAMGYWNDPEKTAKVFVQNPLNRHFIDLIYRTGDQVFLSERGEIMFVGRKDYQIKHLGYRIELPEIEHHVLCIDGIANACVAYNAAKKEITLFYETAGAEITPAAIREHLLAVLPKYMLPTAFHHLPELPRNPNGKVDRNGLMMRLQEQS